ncbi:hypothetical protein [Embleya sp. AB8]|uniref:hypothetical protein n=1 Tax=Embleya sp. AB8 TaxID=3156304 RepID=UPI003C757AEB
MFRELITHFGGTTEGTASEAHAESLLRRAVNRGFRIEAATTGGALITWTAVTFDGPTRQTRAIQLLPLMPVGSSLTESTRKDLDLIRSGPADYVMRNGAREITGLFWTIPQGATARLRARRLVTEGDGPVRVTLTARLALLALNHRTCTTEPAGWEHPGNRPSAGLCKPGRRAGLLYSRTSSVVCECGYSKICGDRDEARREASDHRASVAAEFAKALPIRTRA